MEERRFAVFDVGEYQMQVLQVINSSPGDSQAGV
jgi:hypothetical protein